MTSPHFLQEFFRNWKTVGAVAPSGTALAEQMMESAEVCRARHVLELGPGTGSLTTAIVDSMPHGSGYLGIDLNENFVSNLRPRFPDLQFEVSGAHQFDFTEYLKGRQPFDVIISGLPWAAFPHSLQDAILGNVLPALSARGRFATFAYWGFHHLPKGQRFRSLLHQKLPGVETSRVVWANVPPAFVYVGRK